jgi:hypothetical protein
MAGAWMLGDAVPVAGPKQPVWTWQKDRWAGFWLRRMLHDEVVHRFDAELALQPLIPLSMRAAGRSRRASGWPDRRGAEAGLHEAGAKVRRTRLGGSAANRTCLSQWAVLEVQRTRTSLPASRS